MIFGWEMGVSDVQAFIEEMFTQEMKQQIDAIYVTEFKEFLKFNLGTSEPQIYQDLIISCKKGTLKIDEAKLKLLEGQHFDRARGVSG